jgi:AcrR family transcriptional regulator
VENDRTGCDIERDLTGTKTRIAEAALETLRARGFAGAGARGRARTGGFSQALLLYHFGGVHNALLAALELVSKSRVRAYEFSHLDGDRTPAESLLDLGVPSAPVVEALPSSPRTEQR